jgi:hypothetical protein
MADIKEKYLCKSPQPSCEYCTYWEPVRYCTSQSNCIFKKEQTESEIQSRLSYMVDEEGVMTDSEIDRARKLTDIEIDTLCEAMKKYEPQGLSDCFYNDEHDKLQRKKIAVRQHSLDKLHEEQSVKAERERIITDISSRIQTVLSGVGEGSGRISKANIKLINDYFEGK